MKPIRVLVTGAGSMVGQGIMKALRISKLPVTIIGADIHPLSPALFRADESFLLPKVEKEGSLSAVKENLRDKRIDVVMIGSEYDLEFYSMHKDEIEKETGALIVVSRPEVIRMAGDKWQTVQFLKQNQLPYPASFVPTNISEAIRNANQLGYPVVLKPRSGTSSRHVHIVQSDDELKHIFPFVLSPILQECLNHSNRLEPTLGSEFTCSIFKCRDGRILQPFTARRTLRGGDSWVVEVDQFPDIVPLLMTIGEKLPIMGSLNVQLINGSKPVPFEINARFSGTTAIRAHFGFNEPEMTIRNYFLGENLKQPRIRKGMALRYAEEVFLEDVAVDTITKQPTRGKVEQWF